MKAHEPLRVCAPLQSVLSGHPLDIQHFWTFFCKKVYFFVTKIQGVFGLTGTDRVRFYSDTMRNPAKENVTKILYETHKNM